MSEHGAVPIDDGADPAPGSTPASPDPASATTAGSDSPSPAAAAASKKRFRLVPRSRRGRILTAIVLVLVLGTAAWFAFLRPQAAASTTVTQQTLTISKSTLKTTVSASGTLEPERRADLTFSSSGTVTSVAVAVGDKVTSGQILATIDPASLKIAYQSAAADLTAAEETLTDLKASSSSTTASINAAAASVQVKENALATAKTNLAAATMTAPFDGVVAQVNIATGDKSGSSSGGSGSGSSGGSGSSSGTGSNSSSSSSSSSAAIVVISDGTFNVTTSVSNSDVASIKRGLQATITPTGSSTTAYGTVTSVGVVASSSSSSSGSSTFPVVVHVTGTHSDLLPGGSVTVQIVTSQLTDVISVPTQALTTSNGSTTVKKLVDGAEVETKVTTGEVVGSATVITEGLSEGDQIVVANVRVASGQSTARASSGNSGNSNFGGNGQFSGSGQFPQGGTGQQGAPGQQGGTR